MSRIFYISDTHFGHKNVIKFCGRPYNSIEEMEERLIKNWNKKVTNLDTVYVLGDMFYGKADAYSILNKLKGKKVLVRGNHEQWLEDNEYLKDRFEEVIDYKVINDNNIKVVLFHFPILNWDHKHYSSIHIHGHIHNNYRKDTEILLEDNRYNASVDVNNYEPCTLEELTENKKKLKELLQWHNTYTQE